MSVGALVMITVLALIGLHYFPWWRYLQGRHLPRPCAYVLGMLATLLPFTEWLWERGRMQEIFVLWLTIVAGGLVVVAMYSFDHYVDLEWRIRESDEREILARRHQCRRSTDVKDQGTDC